MRRGQVKPENLLFNANLQEFAQRVMVIANLETAGKKCMELLKVFYYDHLSVDNVATLFGYSSTHSATVAKYKCLEKVRETVKQNSLNYADFID